MMKRLISLACICCLILGFAIPCHAEESVTSPTLYYCIEDDHAIIVDFESPFALSLEIPAEIDGYPVTKIGPAAFSFCTELVEVTIPNTVTFIDDDAFAYCTELKKVHIPEGVETIWEDAFFACYSLTELVLPSTLTTLGNFAFCCCTSLETIQISEGLTTMGVSTFGDCAMTEISLPGSLKVVTDSAFAGCAQLEKVTLAEGITEIADTAFFCCDNLKEITIPSTVTKLGHHIFTYSGMHQIHFLGDAPEFDEECFYDFTATAYYPAGNPTWTDEVMQNYWGNITWMPETAILKGDVTGDGRINVGDVSKLYAHTKKTALLPDDRLPAADLTGDGRINLGDVSKLYASIKKTST